jgi:hypothetical protein
MRKEKKRTGHGSIFLLLAHYIDNKIKTEYGVGNLQ